MIQAVRGTKDLIPGEVEYYRFIEHLAHRIFSVFDYDEIRTPMFEMTSLFVRSIGEETDIVSKEMYTFQDKKGRSLTLRPEGTASVVRALIEHNMLQEGAVNKVYYTGPMFRYERPQQGRQRQFNQVGVEIFGIKEASADAEIISLFSYFLQQMGFQNVITRANTIGCTECRKEYNARLREYLKGFTTSLCPDCQQRAKKNPLRVFDCKQDACKKIIKDAPRIRPFVCDACARHFSDVLVMLERLNVRYTVDDSLVRGFDYYTRTVFEIALEGLGSQDAVMGGGRYDNLVEELGGPPTPGIGASFGVERIVLAMKASSIALPDDFLKRIDIYLIALDDSALIPCVDLTDQLRKHGNRVRFDGKTRTFKSGLRAADRSGAHIALIMGEQEVSDGNILIKELASGEQRHVPLKDILSINI